LRSLPQATLPALNPIHRLAGKAHAAGAQLSSIARFASSQNKYAFNRRPSPFGLRSLQRTNYMRLIALVHLALKTFNNGEPDMMAVAQ
jgi:hypothetical protein